MGRRVPVCQIIRASFDSDKVELVQHVEGFYDGPVVRQFGISLQFHYNRAPGLSHVRITHWKHPFERPQGSNLFIGESYRLLVPSHYQA